MSKLTHFDERGGAHMVDVSVKSDTKRIAVASGRIRMKPTTIDLIRSGSAQKGDVLGVAQVAGIMAAKNTPQIIPMCHPLMLSGVDIEFEVRDDSVSIRATVKTNGKTGVEMEALTAVSAAALTIYDMVKAVDRGMTIEHIQVESKEGGASGEWNRADDQAGMCVDGVCGFVPSGDAPTIDFGTLANIRPADVDEKTPEDEPES